MLCQQIINRKNEPNSFSYLELGIGDGSCFNLVHTDKKVSVDINGLADYNEGTDKFFEQYQGDKFDIIFVDANHEAEFVKRDFNNSIKCIKENGVIYIHDLFPPDEAHCKSNSCGDGYKILNYFVDNNYKHETIREDFGLTAVFTFKNIGELENIDYNDFLKKVKFINFIS